MAVAARSTCNMKIIKQFDSNDFAIKKSRALLGEGRGQTSFWDGTKKEPYWIWGLGDDGELYGKGWRQGVYRPDWTSDDGYDFSISLDEMRKIVKEFGHLLVFL